MRALRKYIVDVYNTETGEYYLRELGELYDGYKARLMAEGRNCFTFKEWAWLYWNIG